MCRLGFILDNVRQGGLAYFIRECCALGGPVSKCRPKPMGSRPHAETQQNPPQSGGRARLVRLDSSKHDIASAMRRHLLENRDSATTSPTRMPPSPPTAHDGSPSPPS